MDFFIIVNGQQEGPFTIAQLAEKKITSDTLVWREGMKDWQPAWMVQELRYILEENARAQYNYAQSQPHNEQSSFGNASGQDSSVPPVPPVNPTGSQQGYNQDSAHWNTQDHFHANHESEYGNSGNQFGNSENQYRNSGDQFGNPRNEQGYSSKKSKKFFTFKLIGILILLLFIIMAVTNPSKESHENAVRTEVSKAIDKATSSSGDDIFSQGFGMVARMIAGNFMDSALDQLFEYHNYILFSKGTVTLHEKSHTVSFGIFGKVITMNADDMVKAIENNDGQGGNTESNDTNEDNSSDTETNLNADNPSNSDEVQDADNASDKSNSTSQGTLQERLQDKADKAVDRMVDKASKKVEERINQKLDEVTDSSTIEKLIDKILNLL